MIFISHRSTDKEVADMLVDFFITTGIDKKVFFCSSLPGNDVKEKISAEIKNNLKTSRINIVVLSRDYYDSAYCLNEAGVIWYNDSTTVIPIALPEINEDNMYGFLNSEYKIRRLDNENDISYVYEVICDATESKQESASVLIANIQKLKNRFQTYIEQRPTRFHKESFDPTSNDSLTDDELILLKYIIEFKVRKVSKSTLSKWLIDNEIYNIDINNGFDLLSTIKSSRTVDDVFELDIECFRKIISSPESLKPSIELAIKRHQQLSSESFLKAWNARKFDDTILLFITYIIDENVTSFGDRWMEKGQIEHIKSWEDKNELNNTLSNNYASCLNFFVNNKYVYESDWTSNGNPREYALCNSLKRLLFETDFKKDGIFEIIKKNYEFQLPF